ncbi:hypothetical protein ACTFIU_009016, partial [Dictyostelium citrinum]
ELKAQLTSHYLQIHHSSFSSIHIMLITLVLISLLHYHYSPLKLVVNIKNHI